MMSRVSRRVAAEGQGNSGAKVWAEVIARAQLPHIVSDLGQGYPDFQGASLARDAASAALSDAKLNQYSPVPGLATLRQALQAHWEAGSPAGAPSLDLDRVLVTTSATEALYSSMQALVDPGDEVIVFEPFFPWYGPCVRMAGGTPVYVRLSAPSFEIDFDQLRSKLSSKTKAILYNSPHNPTGHVSSAAEVRTLAKLLVEKDLLCVSDEVYDCFLFDKQRSPHVRLADEAGCADRVLTVGSASKMFSLTGWRVGWVFGAPSLLAAMGSVHAYGTYCAPTPLQEGTAAALRDMQLPDSAVRAEIDGLNDLFAKNAAVLGAALEALGVKVLAPQGGYFLVADVSATGKTDVDFAEWLAEEPRGIICVPMRVFHGGEDAPTNLVRFAICKTPEAIATAATGIHKAAAAMSSDSA